MRFTKNVIFLSAEGEIIVLSKCSNDTNVFGLMLNLLNRNNRNNLDF